MISTVALFIGEIGVPGASAGGSDFINLFPDHDIGRKEKSL